MGPNDFFVATEEMEISETTDEIRTGEKGLLSNAAGGPNIDIEPDHVQKRKEESSIMPDHGIKGTKKLEMYVDSSKIEAALVNKIERSPSDRSSITRSTKVSSTYDEINESSHSNVSFPVKRIGFNAPAPAPKPVLVGKKLSKASTSAAAVTKESASKQAATKQMNAKLRRGEIAQRKQQLLEGNGTCEHPLCKTIEARDKIWTYPHKDRDRRAALRYFKYGQDSMIHIAIRSGDEKERKWQMRQQLLKGEDPKSNARHEANQIVQEDKTSDPSKNISDERGRSSKNIPPPGSAKGKLDRIRMRRNLAAQASQSQISHPPSPKSTISNRSTSGNASVLTEKYHKIKAAIDRRVDEIRKKNKQQSPKPEEHETIEPTSTSTSTRSRPRIRSLLQLQGNKQPSLTSVASPDPDPVAPMDTGTTELVQATSSLSESSTPFPPLPLTRHDAEIKFRAGNNTITYLVKNFDYISLNGGGNMIRRFLGTVLSPNHPPSPLLGIEKVLKALKINVIESEDAGSGDVDDLELLQRYDNMSRELIQSIHQADGSAYMAMIVTTIDSRSSPQSQTQPQLNAANHDQTEMKTKTPPQKYLDDARFDVERCEMFMQGIASLVGIPLDGSLRALEIESSASSGG